MKSYRLGNPGLWFTAIAFVLILPALGVALVKQGRIDDAQVQFLETLRLDPKNKLAQEHLETIRLLKSRSR